MDDGTGLSLVSVHAGFMGLAGLATLLLGVYLLLRERASQVGPTFFAMTLAASVWLLGFARMHVSASALEAVVWARAAYLGVGLIPAAVYHFTVEALGRGRRRRPATVVLWCLGGLAVGLAAGTDELIVGVREDAFGFNPVFGPLAPPFLLYFAAGLGLAMLEMVAEHRAATPGPARDRVGALMIGFAIAYVAVVDFLPNLGVAIYPFGYAAILAFVVAIALALRRHRFVSITPSFAADEIVDTMADAVLVCDVERRIRFVNEAFGSIFGFGREVLGEPLEVLVDDDPAGWRRLADLLGRAGVRDEEVVFRTAAGVAVDVGLSVAHLHDAAGERVGSVLIARDIRDRKAAQEALERSEARHREILESIEDGYYEVDRAGRLMFFNDALCRILGRGEAELLGSDYRDHVVEGAAERVEEVFQRVWETGEPERGMAFKVVREDGQTRFLEGSASLVRDERDRPIGFRGIIRDVTERERLQDQLRHAQKMEAIGQLAGGIAHDFNNLLTGIIGYADLMLGDLEPGSAVAEDTRGIRDLAGRGADLTRRLLAFSRRGALERRRIDLNQLVADVSKLLERTLGEGVELEFHPDPDLDYVKVDAGAIHQVVLNLAVNARDAMPDGGKLVIETANVELDAGFVRQHEGSSPGPHVMLAITDDGVGMDEATRARIFEPFFTTKDVGKGTGLGLAMAYGIVKHHGGNIWVYSEPGVGTTFKIYLPSARRGGAAEAVGADEEPRRAPARGSETVLVVEDEPAVGEVLTRTLRDAGYRVLIAGGPEEALEVFERHAAEIDLVVTDVILPGRSGPELYESLEGQRPELPVLYVSGYPDKAVRHVGKLTAAGTLLHKPFGPDQLLKQVRRLLDGPVPPREDS